MVASGSLSIQVCYQTRLPLPGFSGLMAVSTAGEPIAETRSAMTRYKPMATSERRREQREDAKCGGS